jgi:succinate-semialdehyde dehydrogenase/glutarate-semialdehyde dehydrogenase
MDRARVLLDIAEAVRSQLPVLSEALSLEQGKTRKEASLELGRFVEKFGQYAGMATAVGGRRVSLGNGIQGIVERAPVGVVAGIVPWNFPVGLFGVKMVPALAAGCAFLIKPAESTPLITGRLVSLLQPFVPAGLVDLVVGGPDVGAYLVRHPGVARVAFTGSTAVGKQVARDAGETLKRTTVELGGADPIVMLEDANLDNAVRCIMGTRYFNAGQVCVAPKRLVVRREVADEVVDRLTQRIQRVRVGPGLHQGSTMGPLHTEQGRRRLEDQIADALDRGARQIGGGRPKDRSTEAGWFVEPSLLIDPPPAARVRSEETFGPVLSVIPVETDDEAVAVANETPFGLGASVWSVDQGRALRLAHRIQSGYTWVNTIARVYDELPFGGVKQSGFGKGHGIEALESYLEDHTYVIAEG